MRDFPSASFLAVTDRLRVKKGRHHKTDNRELPKGRPAKMKDRANRTDVKTKDYWIVSRSDIFKTERRTVLFPK
jgi:hypothetical protein